MNSLFELNGYSLTQITYTDARPSGIVWDRLNPTDQSLIVNENSNHILPIGINIDDIINSPQANVEYVVDLTEFLGDAEVTWGALPVGVTVTETSYNTWTVSGISSASIWDAIKSPTVQIPYMISGDYNYTATIYYTNSDLDVIGRGWDVDLSIVNIDYMSFPTEYVYLGNLADQLLVSLQLTASTGLFDPGWTLTITPSNTSVYTDVTTTSEYGNFSYNPVTKVMVLTGLETEINDILNKLYIDYGKNNQDFTFTYTLTNEITSTIDVRTQDIVSRDLISDQFSNFSMPNMPFTRIRNPGFKNLSLISGLTNSISVTRRANSVMNSQASVVVDQELLERLRKTSYYSNTTASVLTPLVSNIAGFNPIYTLTITPVPSSAVNNFSTSGTGGSSNFNSSTGVLTITGTRDQVNSHLSSMQMTTSTYEGNFNLVYNCSNNLNAKTCQYTQPQVWIEVLAKYKNNRMYWGNDTTRILIEDSNVLALVDPDTSATFKLELTAGTGDFGSAGTLTLSGTRDQVNTLIQSVEYWPARNQSADTNINIKYYKNNLLKIDYTVSLLYQGVSTVNYVVGVYDTAGTFSYTPSTKDVRYRNLDALLVGGGGGASGTRLYNAWNTSNVTASAGGGAGQVKPYYGINLQSVSSIAVAVGAGGITKFSTGPITIGSAGGSSSITVNSTQYSATGGNPGRMLTPPGTALYYNPGTTIALEGGTTDKATTGVWYGSVIVGDNGWDQGVGGAGSSGNSWVGLDRERVLGGPGSSYPDFYTGTLAVGGNGNDSPILDPDVVQPASSSAFGSGGGADGLTVSGVKNGVNGLVVLRTRAVGA